MDDSKGGTQGAGPNYLSYLMRLSQTQSGDTRLWSVSLEETLSQMVLGSHDLDGLFAYLLAHTGQERQANPDSGANAHTEPADRPLR